MIRKLFIVLIVLLLGTSAYADIISGEHYLSDGTKIELSGLEWLSLDNTFGTPTGFLFEHYGEPQIYEGHSDWRFATVAETEKLFSSLFPVMGGADENFEGADWFLNAFGISDTAAISWYRNDFYYGSASDLWAGVVECSYALEGEPSTSDYGYISLWHLDYPCDPEWGCSDPFAGSLLVRSEPIPEPSMILLISTGMLGLLGKRKLSKFKR